jgi:lysophospholipase L1-like esterase
VHLVLRPLAALALAASLVLAVCSASDGHQRDAVQQRRASASIDYVALGDSYSAGPFIPATRPDPPGCARSTNNYPAFLAGYLSVTTYRDVTCSGARVRDFRYRQSDLLTGQRDIPPQLDALSSSTDLVTVGIGGNDYSLFGGITSECLTLAARHPNGSPCERHFTTRSGVNTKYRDARRIRSHIASALWEIHHAAPHARVVIVGYPDLLPQQGTCSAVGFATGDYAYARKVEYLLNRSIRLAAAAHRAQYVNTYRISRGHDICAGDRAWINGKTNDFSRAAAFHPFESGERGMARHVFRVITGAVAPKGGDAMPPPGSIILNTP